MMKTASVPQATTRIATTRQPRTPSPTLNSSHTPSVWWRHPWETPPTAIYLVAKWHPRPWRMDATQSVSVQSSHLAKSISTWWLKTLADDKAKCRTSPKRDVMQCTVSVLIKVKTTYRLSHLLLQVTDHRISPIKNCPIKTHLSSDWMPSQLCHLQEASNEPALLDLKSLAPPLRCSTACARATPQICTKWSLKPLSIKSQLLLKTETKVVVYKGATSLPSNESRQPRSSLTSLRRPSRTISTRLLAAVQWANSTTGKKAQIRSRITIETKRTRLETLRFLRQTQRKLLKTQWWRRHRKYSSRAHSLSQVPNRPKKKPRWPKSNPKEPLSIRAQTRMRLQHTSK